MLKGHVCQKISSYEGHTCKRTYVSDSPTFKGVRVRRCICGKELHHKSHLNTNQYAVRLFNSVLFRETYISRLRLVGQLRTSNWQVPPVSSPLKNVEVANVHKTI